MGDTNKLPVFKILDLNYVSLYLEKLDEGVKFYSEIFGPPIYKEGGLYGWKMGATWLTLLPSSAGTCKGKNPRNTEYAIQVEKPEHVDLLYNKLIEKGSIACMKPQNTWMYEPMRFACVDDPFGVRIDVYSSIKE
jgi:hypothetical protein